MAVPLVETALARIRDPTGEGARAFNALDGAAALEQAAFYDHQRNAGRMVPPYAGIPIGVKDLKGQVTRAGFQQMFAIAKAVEGKLASLRS
jgi:aspartyl-tRNA(Asn)/glutamyl-tRNA(Gln) amidotransferase subunit A